MTLRFFDGFQDALTYPKPEWDGTFSGQYDGRDGTPNGSVGGSNIDRCILLSPNPTTVIFGMAFMVTTNNASNLLMTFYTGTTRQLCIQWATDGTLNLRRTSASGTLLATSSGHPPIAPITWFYLEVKTTLSTSVATVTTVRLNGQVVITYTGATSGATAGVSKVGQQPANTTWFRIDDAYVCDDVDATATQGRPNNDFLGDIRVATLFPNGDGDSSGFTPSSGANHYSLVDEVPPNTTDYVSASVSGTRDLYTVQDVPANVNKVYGVRSMSIATKSDAGAGSLKPLIKENGVATAEPPQGVAYPTWISLFGPNRFVRPSDGGLWTPSDITNLQIGVEVG